MPPHSNPLKPHLLTSLLLPTTTLLTLSLHAHASPFSDNTTSLLDARQTGCIPAAENCDGGKTCCTGLFCSTTAPHTCSKCIGSAGFCRGVPCCDGLFCGLSTAPAALDAWIIPVASVAFADRMFVYPFGFSLS
ncbi:hypothetical protein R3P38DRAFT_2789053 [Favolaschia claudopus]|uniref:Uncharacterized protein n=1 Tax=Favolaschia claudopus TaxID=2862362 RepID=A0AAW0AKG6_9AGAR